MTAADTLRIGILQTDSVRDEFRTRHGDYPDMFRSILCSAVTPGQSPQALEFVDYDVQHGAYPAAVDEVDAYLITGSRDSVYDDVDWIRRLQDFVIELHERRKKLIGICFGHQLVAQALGGETAAAAVGWGVGVHDSQVIAPMPWVRHPADHFALLCSHKDQVARLPAEAVVLASSDFCPVSAFTVGDHFLCFQGHPEFSKAYSETLMRFREELLGAATFEAGVASLARPLEAELVARWILEFILWRGPH